MRIFTSILAVLVILGCTNQALAQFGTKNPNKPRKEKSGLQLFGGQKNGPKAKGNQKTSGGDLPQWSLGIKGGVNLSDVIPTQPYQVITPLDLSSNLTSHKTYDESYTGLGNHIGLTAGFAVMPQLVIGLEPGYATYKFGYQNSYEWQQFEDQQKMVEVDLDVDQVISYLDIPLYFKYHLKTGPLKPFILVGGYYGFRTNADKNISSTIGDSAAGGSGELVTSEQRIGVDDLFIRSSAGLMGGAGVSLDLGGSPADPSGGTDLGTVRFLAGVNYRHGLHNIVDVKNRFEDSILTSGYYDVTDDLELRSLEIYLGVQFTLKYKDFK